MAGPKVLWIALAQLYGRMRREPVAVILMLWLVEQLKRWYSQRRMWLLGGQLAWTDASAGLDFNSIKGSLISLQNLQSLGRVEERVLFVKPTLDVLMGNRHLADALASAARRCQEHSANCLAMRWLRGDEKYHILQACVNVASSLFGSNHVHFNAAGGGAAGGGAKSVWYCVTIMMPTRPSARQPSKTNSSTATFTDMSRRPVPRCKLVLVNESELRRMVDGKFEPPTWGFFNDRHAERYQMLLDFAQNWRHTLALTTAQGHQMDLRNPFTSEMVHRAKTPDSEVDPGTLKRVRSQPVLSPTREKNGGTSRAGKQGARLGLEKGHGSRPPAVRGAVPASLEEIDADADDQNCFLRVHVPFVLNPVADSGRRGNSGTPWDKQVRQISTGAL